jgi:hypothetical protein
MALTSVKTEKSMNRDSTPHNTKSLAVMFAAFTPISVIVVPLRLPPVKLMNVFAPDAVTEKLVPKV